MGQEETHRRLQAAMERMARNRDERPEAIRLLANIKSALPELEALRQECADEAEDAVYRFYTRASRSTRCRT